MKLKELRNQKKISQQEIAKILNVTQTTYGRYELEISEPNINTLCNLADFYNVTIDYLIGRNFINDIGYLSEQQKTAVELIKQLNEKNLNFAIAYLSGMIVNQ